MKRVRVDFNARDARDYVPLPLARLGADLTVGEAIEVYDGEEGFYGPATIAEVDSGQGLVYLDIAWSELRDPDPMPRVEVKAEPDLMIVSTEGIIIVEVKSYFHRTLAELWATVERHPGHNTRIAGYERDEDLIAS